MGKRRSVGRVRVHSIWSDLGYGYATPMRGKYDNEGIEFVRLLIQWLCHADARQVLDLPACMLLFLEGL